MEKVYSLVGLFSFGVLIAAVVLATAAYKKKESGSRVLSALHILTFGVFVSTFFIFLPVYYYSQEYQDVPAFVRLFFLSLHNTFRVFILDGEFDIISKSVSSYHKLWSWLFSFYAACLYVAAPVLTFGNVLSLFKNVWNEMRFSCVKRRPIFAFSELNERSIALAGSIAETKAKGKTRPVLVFTDVFEHNEEKDYELLLKAHDLNAICLRKDITRLKYKRKKSNVELFLIGDHEEENVDQATTITTALNAYGKKQNVKLFVFAAGTENGYIIDSLDYNALLDGAKKEGFGDNTFKIRRVDGIRQLVWNTVPQMDLFRSSTEDQTISVLIAGMGSYGMEFFKMLVWYCQSTDYKLEINMVDKVGAGSEKPDEVMESILSRQCPELMKKNRCKVEGDACYDIKCYGGIDFETSRFAELLEKENRLQRTTVAIVALGDDNDNIRTAVYLRTLFDRQNNVIASEQTRAADEKPQIYAVVYNSTKSGVVSKDNGEFLKNYKEIPYHIHFIGALEEQYSYHNIYDFKLENDAFRYHVAWVNVSFELLEEIKRKKYDPAKAGNVPEGTIESLIDAQKKYEQFEYYRLSSMARAIFVKGIVARHHSSLEREEHCRWNAYMRSCGYVYGPRADRAMQHDNLVTCQELDALNDGSPKKDEDRVLFGDEAAPSSK